MFKDLPEGQTYSCEKHVCDSEELNPRCHICGILMRDDSVQSESIEWEKELQDYASKEGHGNGRCMAHSEGAACCLEKDWIKSFISQAITTAVAKERQRILGLPCMEREDDPEAVHDLTNQFEMVNAIANFNWSSGRNFLRRELKEEVNI